MQAMFPVVGSFSMVGFALVYRNRLFMYLAFGLVCLSLMFAFGMRWSQSRGVRKRRQRNRSLRELAAVMVVDWPELGLAT